MHGWSRARAYTQTHTASWMSECLFSALFLDCPIHTVPIDIGVQIFGSITSALFERHSNGTHTHTHEHRQTNKLQNKYRHRYTWIRAHSHTRAESNSADWPLYRSSRFCWFFFTSHLNAIHFLCFAMESMFLVLFSMFNILFHPFGVRLIVH